jgi:glutamate synthase (NADPH/NADH) small chain
MPVKRADKTPMPERDAGLRAHDFLEVNQGFDLGRAMFEAERCLRCQDAVCVEGCPVGIPIPDFIHAIAANDMPRAAAILRAANPLPAICGRVCPQESQCELLCHMSKRFSPAAIGHLERFVADWERAQPVGEKPESPWRAERVAVIGSGPAGLVCAGQLARMGYPVTVYEGLHAAGGVLRYGIPEFRLPKAILDWEIALLERLGVEIVCNVIVGKTITVDDLFERMGFAAVFVGTGAGLPKFLGIPGENLNGVYSANEFLTRINLMRAYQFPKTDTPIKTGKRVAVIGSGNTAMDTVRCALRMGAEEALVVYRRSENEMTARIEEYHHAIEEGVEFHWLTNPVEILGNQGGWVTGLKCQVMELGEPDDSGRARPVPVAGTEFVIPVDNVVLSIGNTPNPLLLKTTHGLAADKRGCLIVDEATAQTSLPRVYAGGDIVTGAATVILAAGAGKSAAGAIHRELSAGYPRDRGGVREEGVMGEIILMLREEHGKMTKLLDILEREIEAFNAGGSPDFDVVTSILDYCLNFPELCHHPKEEVVYRKLLAHDRKAAEAIGDLEEEHAVLTGMTRRFAATVRNVLADAELPHDWVAQLDWDVKVAQEFVDFYRRHIEMEESRLFPAAVRSLTLTHWIEINAAVADIINAMPGAQAWNHYQSVHGEILRFAQPAGQGY